MADGYEGEYVSRKQMLEGLRPNLCCYKCSEPPTKSKPNRQVKLIILAFNTRWIKVG